MLLLLHSLLSGIELVQQLQISELYGLEMEQGFADLSCSKINWPMSCLLNAFVGFQLFTDHSIASCLVLTREKKA